MQCAAARVSTNTRAIPTHANVQWLDPAMDDAALCSACAVIVALTTADDTTAPASRSVCLTACTLAMAKHHTF